VLPKQHRLTSRRDFRITFTHGKSYVHSLFVMKVLHRIGGPPSRFAFSASSKLRKAVVRNRTKRLLRETVRLLGEQVKPTGYDVVIIGRPPIKDASFLAMCDAVKTMFRRVGLLSEDGVVRTEE
jgi:ribonuclease P protein component